jgi:hypothetical protein
LRDGILALLAVLAVLSLTPHVATGLHVIDFEQPYYVHPDWQVWDFCLIHRDGLYQIFYGAVPMVDGNPLACDHLWRSTSADLIHWSEPTQVLAVSDAAHENRAVWAPDVVNDPTNGFWWMAYTGVGDGNNQRICIAYSSDLLTWYKSPLNPVQEPSPPIFFYDPDGQWGECRDPFLFRENNQWHMLTTVKTSDLPSGQAALAVASAVNMHEWHDPEVFLLSGSSQPTASLESSQYIVRDGVHHLLFHEYATNGVSHLAANEVGGWDFADRSLIDGGLAPEVDTFDGGESWIFSRVAPFREPHLDQLAFVIRFDSLAFAEGLAPPSVDRALPLAREFEEFVGNSVLGNPVFGDNPERRGEDAVGHLGQCYFGSGEYYQGPLSGRGQPGQTQGDVATGWLRSHPFVIEGNSISLRVGGSDQPDLCYVALVDAQTDTIIHRASGDGFATMTERWWDTAPLSGREVYIFIEDASVDGHINVDHIQETMTALSVRADQAGLAPGALRDRGAHPNPANPRVTLSFEAERPTTGRVRIYDLRGRQIWQRDSLVIVDGLNELSWSGCDQRGIRAPGGVYLYRIESEAGAAVSGKITLAP